MAKKTFDMTELFNSVSSAEQENVFVIEMIDIYDIETNEINNYTISEIEKLALSISLVGLKQNLDVKPAENGKYKLLSGERRYTAIKMLVEEQGREDLRLIPCTVTKPKEINIDIPEEIKELWLYTTTNADQRTKTEGDIAEDIRNQKIIFNALLNAGVELKGRQRDMIAEVLKMSPRQVQRYEYVDKHLEPEIKQGFESGAVPLTVAVTAAQQEPEVQKEIKKTLEQTGTVTAKDVETAITVVKAKEEKPTTQTDNAELIKAWANDESRKAFIEKYETWEVDAVVPKYDMKYFKYILPDGSFILAMKHNDTAYNPDKGEYGYVTRVWYYLKREDELFVPNTASVTQVCEKLKDMKEFLK